MGTTKQRRVILNTITNTAPHMTAEEIYNLAKKKLPSISEGTVYRNLNILADEGIVRRLFLPNSPVRYESNPARHGHLVCEGCGLIADIFLDSFTAVEEEARAKGIGALGVDIVMTYICPACERAHAEAAEEAGL